MLVLTLLPITWALAFPEPNDRRLCDPNTEGPPRLAQEDMIGEPPSATTPVVRFLNPTLAMPPPKVSDKYDGRDRRYHVTVVAVGVPSEALLELYVVGDLVGGERLLGTLCPVDGTADTFEGFWDIPDTFPEGVVDLVAKAFDRPGDGASVVATDQISVDVQHRAEGSQIVAENVSILWPPNDGPLGFFRNKDGRWSASVEGIGGPDLGSPQVRYSTTPLGAEPSFKACDGGSATTTTRASDQARQFTFPCRLAGGDRPSAVTAVAVVAGNGTQSSDANRVHPFLQTSSEMSVDIQGAGGAGLGSATYPTSTRRVAGSNCLQFKAIARDRFGRPVPGANIDIELRGPKDEASFGPAVSGNAAQAPDAAPVTEPTLNCNGTANPSPTALRQERRVVADGPDAKVIESTEGTDDQGGWEFRIVSAEPGRTDLKAWVDSEPLEGELAERRPDDDQIDPDEGSGTSAGHWMEAPLTLEISPADEVTQVGTCRIYRLQALGGTTLVSDLNIDIHARMPDPNFEICGPGEDTLTKPDLKHEATHVHPQDDAATTATGRTCPGTGPPCYHYEGNTDDNGELVFGIGSAVAGNSVLNIWADGESGQDDDDPPNQDPGASNHSNPLYIQFVTKWVDELAGSPIKLLAPSDQPTPITMGNGLQKVSDDSFRIIARAPAPNLVDKALIEITPPNSGQAVEIGEATRIGNTNYYQLTWDLTLPLSSYEDPDPEPSPSPSQTSSPGPVPSVSPPAAPVEPGVPDGSYTVTVRTERGFDSRPLVVQRSDTPPDDTTPPLEWATLTSPSNGAPLGFVDGETNLGGTASPRADGVYFFYTAARFTEKPNWEECGFRLFSGVRTTNQSNFNDGKCKLQGIDRASRVTGVAVVPWNCEVETTGCAAPTPPPVGGSVPVPRSGAPGAGDTLAVTGCEGNPCIVLAPGEWSADKGTCAPFTVMATQRDLAASNFIVGVEFQGPTDGSRFCDPEAGGDDDEWSASPEFVDADPFGPDVHRITGTTRKGEFTFGVRSDVSNFTSIYSTAEAAASVVTAWLDDGDLEFEEGERSASANVHWQLPDRCTVIGTDRSDVLTGTVHNDKICGLNGADEVFAQEGNDVILGGDGDDKLFGDEGRDKLYGEAGDDVLVGGGGADFLDGGDGFDICRPGPGQSQQVVNCEKVVLPDGSVEREKIPSTIALAYRTKDKTFIGTVDSAKACRAGRQISVFRLRDGRDALVGSTQTETKGRFSLKREDVQGRFYALVTESLVNEKGKAFLCGAAQSRAIRIE